LETTIVDEADARRAQFPDLYPVAAKKSETPPNSVGKCQRFALARYAAWQFINSRMEASQDAIKQGKQGDRVGIGTFDDIVYPSYPLTAELKIPSRKIAQLLNAEEGLNIHIYALVCGPKSQLTNDSTQTMRKLIQAGTRMTRSSSRMQSSGRLAARR
jgi:hypothetical protein